MSWEFRPEMEVVCVDDDFVSGKHPDIEKGRIYVISDVVLDTGDYPGMNVGRHQTGVSLVFAGICPMKANGIFMGNPYTGAFSARRFRPLRKRETSIEIFKSMLTPSNQREDADA